MPVRLVNDARAFTLAEARVGAGKGCSSLIGVTLGTGVGGGIVIDGRLVLGLDGTAGEIGHLVIDIRPEAPKCGCGNTGCLEAYVGAPRLAEAAGTATAADAFARGRARRSARARGRRGLDRLPRDRSREPRDACSRPTASCSAEASPRRRPRIIDPLRERLAAHVHLTDPDHVQIVCAALGTRAGAIGAALRGLDA